MQFNSLDHSLTCPKTCGKRPKQPKSTKKMIIFHNFEHSSLHTSPIEFKKKMGAQLNMTLLLFCAIVIEVLLYLPKNLGKRTQTDNNTIKWSFFIILNTPPCQLRSQNKIIKIENTTACGTLIIFWNSNISHPLTCPKTWEKGPKRLKILKNDQFS